MPLLIIAAVISLAVGVWNYIQMRKQMKKNQQKPNQLDGTIADEGTSFSDIAGSPHMYGNMTHIWGQTTKPIYSKGGKK
jgi:hypothetical protein